MYISLEFTVSNNYPSPWPPSLESAVIDYKSQATIHYVHRLKEAISIKSESILVVYHGAFTPGMQYCESGAKRLTGCSYLPFSSKLTVR